MIDFLGLIVAFVVIVFVGMGLRKVRPWEKGLVERLGKYQRTAGSGLTFIVPFIDMLTKVDMREQVVDVPPQEVITKDNVVVTVDAIVYYEATDPVKLQYNVANFYMAVTKLAQTNLRNIVGDMALDESLTSRETINAKLRLILDQATDKWGVRVVRVEIQKIEPPADVQQAMHRQMKAERERRAKILDAEGDRGAAIERAEGEKQASILRAEGQAFAIQKVADADRYKLLTVAQGEGEAIVTVFKAIHEGGPTTSVIAVRYLEALKAIADGRASKVFIPYEATGVMASIGSIGEMLRERFPDAGAGPSEPHPAGAAGPPAVMSGTRGSASSAPASAGTGAGSAASVGRAVPADPRWGTEAPAPPSRRVVGPPYVK